MKAVEARLDAEAIADKLRSYVFHFNSEEELQSGIERALRRERIPFIREFPLNAHNRIDFLSAGIGIEVKTEGSRSAVLRQLDRYCGFDCIGEMILVTRKHRHGLGVDSLRGKPVHVVHVGAF